MAQAAIVLLTVGLAAVPVRAEDVAELAALLETDRAGEAAMKLAELGPAAKEAVPQLVRALANEKVAWRAAWALSRIGPDAAVAAPELARVISTEYGLASTASNIAFCRIGPDTTQAAVTALSEAPDKWSEGGGPMTKAKWIDLLADMRADSDLCVPALAKLLDNDGVRDQALEGLARMGARGVGALPALA